MRPIEFRAWDPQYKKMFYHHNLHVLHLSGTGAWTLWDTVHDKCLAGCGTGKLMRFTGLLDKNGKKIFEGDIVQCNPKVKYYRCVVFNQGNYWLINPDRKSDWEIQCVISSHPETKVIGDIYSNPELVKP